MRFSDHIRRTGLLEFRQQPLLPNFSARRQSGGANQDPYLIKVSLIIKLFCLLGLFALLPGPKNVQASSRHKQFPEYPIIRNNIAFWEKIYSVYSINSAVIHDQNDLTKIYTVVKLVDKDDSNAHRINKNRIDTAENKYSWILKRLAAGHRPATRDEARVAAMFKGPSARRDMFIAANNIRAQIGQKERFHQGLIRSVAYIQKIRQIFRAYGLPPDLAYIPHVESSFNPYAYSKSGAAGIWQFTRSTGRHYLKINRHVDQRRDPIISTRAAAKLLKKNYEALGSWPLAITAYNYGTAGMLRAVEASGSYVNIFKHYREGYFKFASRNFYSEFLAAKNIAERFLRQYGRSRQIAATSRPLIIHGHKPIHLARKGRIKYIVSRSSRRIRHIRPVLRPRFYIVKQGDTASSIAAAHNISVDRLCRVNNLGPKALIRIGQNLKIPAHRQTNSEKPNLQSSTQGGRQSAMILMVPTGSEESLPRLAVVRDGMT